MAPKPKPQKTSKGKDLAKCKDDMDASIRLDHCGLSLSDILAVDHEYSLSKYTSVVARPDGAVTMEDVDRIQLELEALLSAATIRRKHLSGEVRTLHGMDKRRGRPFGQSSAQAGPGSPGKSGRAAQRPVKKFKDSFGRPKEPTPVKPAKVRAASGGYNPEDILPQIKADPSAVSPAVKNDIPDKFWTAMEQYCGPITPKDVEMLERLSAEQEDTEDFLVVPPLGRHYTLKWAEEDGDSKDGGSDSGGDENKVKNKTKSEECSSMGVFTQRLVSGLVEENVLSSVDGNAEGGGKETDPVQSRPGLAATAAPSSAAQLERRLKRELESCGIVDDSDGPVAVPGDEVLAELERCQSRLSALTSHNAAQLERLLRLGRAELRRQQLRDKLSTTDAQVKEAYQAIASARQRKKSPSKKERDAAWKALKDRDAIIKLLDAQ